MSKIIIFDETDGKSLYGKRLKEIATRHKMPYVTNSKDLLDLIDDQSYKGEKRDEKRIKF